MARYAAESPILANPLWQGMWQKASYLPILYGKVCASKEEIPLLRVSVSEKTRPLFVVDLYI